MKNNIFRKIKKLIRGYPLELAQKPLIRHQQAFNKAIFIIEAYYWITIYTVVNIINKNWSDWLTTTFWVPLWPVRWINLTSGSIRQIALWVACIALLVAVLTALQPQKKILRVLLFISFLELAAFANSFGKINHGLHLWLTASFIFIFLPNQNWLNLQKSTTQRQLFLTVFWMAQALPFLFYSMSGVLKVVAGVHQFLLGQVHVFHPYALSYQIASRLLDTGSESLLGSVVLNYPWIGWPLYLIGLYLEVFAFVAVFRPALHRLWGVFMIMFHLGNFLFMTVLFTQNILFLGLFFALSPFQPPQTSLSLRMVIYNLPLIGDCLQLRATLSTNQHKLSFD